MQNIDIKSFIDTIQTKELETNRENFNNIKGTKCYTNPRDKTAVTEYSPNNHFNVYKSCDSLAETEEVLKKMMTALTVINAGVVSYKRVDVATDIAYKFKDSSKLLELLHKCLCSNFKEEDGGKAWNNEDQKDYNLSNFRFKNRDISIEFYDKAKESDGYAPYPTRMEIRFLRISSKELKLQIKKSIKLWQSVVDNLKTVEDIGIKILKKKWIEEKQLNPNLKLNMFIYKWSHKIFTLNMLNEICKFAGVKNFSSWKYKNFDFEIQFYTKTELKNFSKDVIKSFKKYLKNQH